MTMIYDANDVTLTIGGIAVDFTRISYRASLDSGRSYGPTMRYEARGTAHLDRRAWERLLRALRPRDWRAELARAAARRPPWPTETRGTLETAPAPRQAPRVVPRRPRMAGSRRSLRARAWRRWGPP